MFRKAFSANLASSLVGVAALVAVLAVAANAQPSRVQVGKLACSISAGVGLIVGSQRNVSCNFQPENGPPTGGAMVWGVFTDTNRYAGMLSGTYVGAQAEATVAAGLGANVLVGGSNRSVALQPVSVQGQTGLNIAAGVGALDLHYAQ
jgi:hypothetical protein